MMDGTPERRRAEKEGLRRENGEIGKNGEFIQFPDSFSKEGQVMDDGTRSSPLILHPSG